MLFLILNTIRRHILLILAIIVVLVYAGINVPYVQELQELILRGIDSLSAYLDLKGLAKQVQDSFNNIRKML